MLQADFPHTTTTTIVILLPFKSVIYYRMMYISRIGGVLLLESPSPVSSYIALYQVCCVHNTFHFFVATLGFQPIKTAFLCKEFITNPTAKYFIIRYGFLLLYSNMNVHSRNSRAIIRRGAVEIVYLICGDALVFWDKWFPSIHSSPLQAP
jgi:hypothetical protein